MNSKSPLESSNPTLYYDTHRATGSLLFYSNNHTYFLLEQQVLI